MVREKSFKKTVLREFEVAFSSKSQKPVFRVLKYVVLISLLIIFRHNPATWWILGIVLALSLSVHFFVRYKTKGWTRSWGRWKYMKSRYDP
jgi:hypothetical protein